MGEKKENENKGISRIDSKAKHGWLVRGYQSQMCRRTPLFPFKNTEKKRRFN
jgi:hypothetical protein